MSYAPIINDYRKYLSSAAKMRAHIEANLVRGALPDALVAGFAKVHAQCYQCKLTINKNGAYKFKDDKGGRHVAAQGQWDRVIDPYHKRIRDDKRGGNRYKVEQVTPRKTKRVAELLVMFNDLSAAERAAFLAGVK